MDILDKLPNELQREIYKFARPHPCADMIREAKNVGPTGRFAFRVRMLPPALGCFTLRERIPPPAKCELVDCDPWNRHLDLNGYKPEYWR